MARLRTTTPFDYRNAVETAVAAPRKVRHTHTPRGGTISQASRMDNPPPWLEELDLTPWAERRIENLATLRLGTRPQT